MSCYLLLGEKVMTLRIAEPVVLCQASGNTTWASGLGVMTLPLRGKGRRFESGLAHF